MIIKNLYDTQVEDIVDCLHDAFSDYAIPMKMPVSYWQDRWEMACIDYELSFGLFDENTLQGFVLHGVDVWHEEKCFYNMATGVRPSYRGHRTVKKIYEAVLERMKGKGIKSGYLEVLCDNKKAIRAYETSGFNIVDEMHSYNIPLDLARFSSLQLNKLSIYNPEDYSKMIRHKLSFEHRTEIIKRMPDAFNCYELVNDGQCVAFGILKKSNKNIVQFGYSEDSNIDDNAMQIFAYLAHTLGQPRIINISLTDEAITKLFKRNNFGRFISQYLMHIKL